MKTILMNVGVSILENLNCNDNSRKALYEKILEKSRENNKDIENGIEISESLISKYVDAVLELIEYDEEKKISAELKSITLFNEEKKIDDETRIVLIYSNTYEAILSAYLNESLLRDISANVSIERRIISRMKISEFSYKEDGLVSGNAYDEQMVTDGVNEYNSICNEYDNMDSSEIYFCLTAGYKLLAIKAIEFSFNSQNNIQPFMAYDKSDCLNFFDENDFSFEFEGGRNPDNGSKLILFTVGTSLLQNVLNTKKIREKISLISDDMTDIDYVEGILHGADDKELCEWVDIFFEELVHLLEEYDFLSAEIKAVRLLIIREATGSSKVDIVPLSSDTKTGILCARLVKKLLEAIVDGRYEKLFIKTEEVITGLKADNDNLEWNECIENVDNCLINYIRKPEYEGINMCVNGGFKFISVYCYYVSLKTGQIHPRYIHIGSNEFFE